MDSYTFWNKKKKRKKKDVVWFPVVFSSFLGIFLKKIFLSSSHVWSCPHLRFPGIRKFPFLRAFWFFLDLIVLFLSFVVFRFSWFTWHIFHARFHPFVITIFTNPSAWARYDTGSILKRGLTGLNSEFSFSWTSCLTKADEP